MKRLPVTGSFLLGIVLLAGCDDHVACLGNERFAEEDKVLVRVNGMAITEYDLTYWLRGAHDQKITPELRDDSLDRLIDGELAYQRGRELGLHHQESYRKEIRKLQLQLRARQRAEMMERVYNREVAANVNVDPAEVRQYFTDYRDRFERRLHLATLRFDTATEARRARQRIEAGEAFDDPADLRQSNRWDTGLLPWSKIPLEWHDVVFALEPGEVSTVFEGDRTGIRLFKLLGTEPIHNVEFKDVRNSIMNRLRDARARDAFKAYVARLRKTADIEPGRGHR